MTGLTTQKRQFIATWLMIVGMLLSIFAVVPIRMGLVELGLYQFFAFALLPRLGWAMTAGVLSLGLGLILLLAEFIPPALLIEYSCMLILLRSADPKLFGGAPATRVPLVVLTITAVAFPLYTAYFALIWDYPIIHASGFGVRFSFTVLIAFVGVELFFMMRRFSGKSTPLAAFDESPDKIFPRLADVSVVVLTSQTMLVLVGILILTLLGWERRLEGEVQRLGEVYASSLYEANRQELLYEVGDMHRRIRFESPTEPSKAPIWIFLTDRRVHISISPEATGDETVSESSLLERSQLLPQELLVAIDKNWQLFAYRVDWNRGVSQGWDADDVSGNVDSPLSSANWSLSKNAADYFYLEVEERRLPVFLSVNDQTNRIVFSIERNPTGILDSLVNSSNRRLMALRYVSSSDPLVTENLAGNKQLIDTSFGSVAWLWKPSSGPESYASVVGQVTNQTRISVPLSGDFAETYAHELDKNVLVFDQGFYDYFLDFCTAMLIVFIAFAAACLILSWSIQFSTGLVMAPIRELIRALGDTYYSRKRAGLIGFGFEAIDLTINPAIREVDELQRGFFQVSNEVALADQQLGRSIANYEDLLSNLPLGVMAIDGDYQVRFSNAVMRQLLSENAEAIYKLRRQAEYLFESEIDVQEWGLSDEGRVTHHFLLVITPRLDESGEASGFWLLVTDLTEKKQLDAQLIQTAKLASVGEMSTGMAHELNQPLNIIRLAANNLSLSVKKGRATPESISERLQRIEGAVDRAAAIIDHMRAFGRVSGAEFETFNATKVISDAIQLLREQLQVKGVNIVNDIESPYHIVGNVIQFEQVLINVINNARDAILEKSDNGIVTLSAVEEDTSVVFTIDDTGGGIPPEALPHVFEPFFTTKPVGKGTGLGGSISYGIIQDMQGSIWASNWERGARISIRLPIADESVESS